MKTDDIEIITGGGGDEMENDWRAENRADHVIIKDLVEISISNSWKVTGIDMEKYIQKSFADKVG